MQQQYPNQQYPNQQYPNQQYPNQQYPNQQYPNQQYPNQQYQQYPNQQYQQYQPANYNGMVGDTMKTMQPVYDVTATIGIAYAIFSTVIVTIISVFVIYFGVWIKNMNAEKTEKTVGTIKDTTCSKTKNDKSCVATISYIANKIEYSVSTTTGIVNKGQTVDIYYEPKNPNNFSLSNNTTNAIGWIIIIVASIILLSSWGWLLMTIFFKPVAAATGVGAVAGAIMPDNDYNYT